MIKMKKNCYAEVFAIAVRTKVIALKWNEDVLEIAKEYFLKQLCTYFSKNDSIEYIGFIKIDNTLYKFYQNKHLFNDYRMTWRLIVIRDENIIGWYNQIQSTPKVEKSYLVFDFQEEYGNKIDFSKGIPLEVYLDGEIINFEKIEIF